MEYKCQNQEKKSSGKSREIPLRDVFAIARVHAVCANRLLYKTRPAAVRLLVILFMYEQTLFVV